MSDKDPLEAKDTVQSWTPEEERAALRKLDLRLLPWMILCYTALGVDRGNMSQANIMNAEQPTHTFQNQLGLQGNQFNWALSIFFFGFVIFEVPSNLVITRFNPSRWLSRIMTTWGLVAACMGATTNFQGLMAVRFFLGCMESGFGPGAMLYFTFWYKKYEVSSRWATMYGGSSLVQAFSGLLAYAIANMDGAGGLAGWRWLFILEGLASSLVGVGTWFILPDYPQTAKFLTPREKEIIIGRLPPSAPSMVAKEIKWGEVIEAFKDWRMYLFGLVGFMEVTTAYAIGYFQPTVIRLMGFLSTQAQLLAVPPATLTAFFIIFMSYSSDRFQQPALFACATLIPPICGYFLLANVQPQLSAYGRYGLLFLISPANAFIPVTYGFATISTKGTSKAAIRAAVVGAMGNLGGAVGSQVYQPTDAPFYSTGHYINACLLIGAFIGFAAAYTLVAREGEYVGRKANITVKERGGVELNNGDMIAAELVMQG